VVAPGIELRRVQKPEPRQLRSVIAEHGKQQADRRLLVAIDPACACFMCGALSERGEAEPELAFARDLINRVVEGAPRDRVALHICRGNWTPDESAALRGDYRPLLPLLQSIDVGTFLLELCTPRAGELEVLRDLPESCRIGVGVVNQKRRDVEPAAEIRARIERAISLFGRDRVLIQPDCGFATFADNPVASAAAAQVKIAAMVEAVGALR